MDWRLLSSHSPYLNSADSVGSEICIFKWESQSGRTVAALHLWHVLFNTEDMSCLIMLRLRWLFPDCRRQATAYGTVGCGPYKMVLWGRSWPLNVGTSAPRPWKTCKSRSTWRGPRYLLNSSRNRARRRWPRASLTQQKRESAALHDCSCWR